MQVALDKRSGTRIKPLPLASGRGHNRYITVTPERKIRPLDNESYI
jgi:hypothetical protein